MIVREWHGWTSRENAGRYEALFRGNGPNTQQMEGRIGAYLLRRDLGDEVEFVVQHQFRSMDAVRAVYGENFETARLIPGAETILSRYDQICAHYIVVEAPSSL
jgi:quinol monooxygenase YgiN